MSSLNKKTIDSYRELTFRTKPGLRLHSPIEAQQFVNERGFIFFWPVKNIQLPSLWAAVAGDRPVPNDHDDPGHITWDWKDNSLGKKFWYYAKILHHRATFISLSAVPFFYALSPNFGDPEEDIHNAYHQGTLSLEAKLIFEALHYSGPLDTIALRKASHLSGENSSGPFARGLDLLQAEFRILPVGVADAGAWHYSYIYDLSHRHFPWLIDKAGSISIQQVRQEILSLYIQSIGACTRDQVARLFRWPLPEIEITLTHLSKSGFIHKEVDLENQNHMFVVLSSLL